jgi:hypothetical protein
VQTLDSQLITALDQDHELIGTPVVIAEWNFNRLVKATAKNISDPTNLLWPYTQSHFPPSSITEGFRPDAGMIYGFTGKAYPISDEQLGSGGNRYYYCDKDSMYKYWISPTPSDNAYNILQFGQPAGEYPIENSNLQVDYDAWIKVNKIKVVFNGDVRPNVWRIAVFDKILNDWTTIATSPTINSVTGRAEIWWDGSSWIQTQQLDISEYKEINKIRVEFDSLTLPNERLQIIEIAGMREVDLSDRVQRYSIDMSMDDVDYIHPIGQMSSNDGSILLDNRDLEINLSDSTKDFYGLIDGWCEYRTYVNFDMSKYATSDKLVRTGTMYSNSWTATNPYEYDVSLFDIVKILQNIKCPSLLVENKTIARIMSMMLDMVGIDKYEFNFEDFDPTETIKYFWTDGTETVYDVLNRICKSHQCVIFADEFGKLQLITRNQLVNDEDEENFTLRSTPDGLVLPNIIDLQKKYDISINDVEIKYKRREANIDSTDVTGKILTSKVWDTSDPIVVRAAPIMRTMTSTAVPVQHVGNNVPADIFIPADKVATWPYSGYINIDGEVMKYEGKGYAVINYTTGTWGEKIIKNDEDRRKWDKFTYDSYTPTQGVPGGISGQPVTGEFGIGTIITNRLTGRLRITQRGLEGSKWAEHAKDTKYGWGAFNVWCYEPGSSIHPGKYIEPGKVGLVYFSQRDWINKPGWGREQRAWTQSGSKLIGDNTWKPSWRQLSAQIIQLDDTEYRDFGMRFKFTDGVPAVGMMFCISSQNGYADDPFETDPTACHRFYQITLHSTDLIEAAGNQTNEVGMGVKNGNNMTALNPMHGTLETSGKIRLDKNVWYDLDVVLKDHVLPDGQNKMSIEVFINGQYLDTFETYDVIRPTNLMGIFTRYAGKAEFEYVYASTTTGFNKQRYSDETAFGATVVQLPAGTNVTKVVNIPDNWWVGKLALSISSLSQIDIHSLKVYNWWGSVVNNLGPAKIKPDSKKLWLLSDGVLGDRNAAVKLNINYTSTEEISVLVESSLYGAIPYYGYRDVYHQFPSDMSYWSFLKNGYASTKLQHLLNNNTTEFDKGYTNQITQYTSPRKVFYDDFGSIVREIRDFDVEYSVSPAKGTSIYVSNPEVAILSFEESPSKGIFRLVNTSHQDQIVNGNEQIDETNNIEHSLLVYGYVLIDKEDKTKRIKNEESIRKHGPYPIELDAEWINSDDEANSLAEWIVDNWGGIMDTIEVKSFLNVAAQIGDKVKVVYPESQIDPTWLFLVSKISKDYDSNGLSTSLTLRRVR